MLMYFYWQLSCPLLFLILSTSPTPHYFLSPTTMSSPLIHLQPLSQLPLLHPLIPTVNSPSVYCFSLSCPTLILTPYLSVDLVLHLSVWCKIKEGGMGKPQGEVNTLHACHSELHRALEIGVRSTNFSSEEKPTAFIHPSGLYVCTSEVQDLCKAEHLHSPVSGISSFFSGASHRFPNQQQIKTNTTEVKL